MANRGRSSGEDGEVRPSRTTIVPPFRAVQNATRSQMLCLTIAWSEHEMHRIGETAVLERRPGEEDRWFCIGRADTHPTDIPLTFAKRRPSSAIDTGPFESLGVSRVQWRIKCVDDGLEIINVGRRQLLHNRQPIAVAIASPGDLLEIEGEALLLVGLRPVEVPSDDPEEFERLMSKWRFPFGGTDAHGFVGESMASWEVRQQISFSAARTDNILITGPSGSGKELAAQAIHTLSPRGRKPMVSRNAATLPESIIDAELFGNVRDYPNVGTPERPGLVGAAEGTTLFLDEIGEISFALQAHLLRVLDVSEYQKLGDPKPRTANMRVIAATNREPRELKHDLLPRLRLRLTMPGLNDRREDIPLIALRLLQAMGAADSGVARRFFRDANTMAEPRWTARFISSLMRREYTTHVRELDTLLLNAMSASTDGTLDRIGNPDRAELAKGSISIPMRIPSAEESASNTWADPRNIGVTQLREALGAANGSRERAWRLLGLRNRHQLMRLLRKFGDELALEFTDEENTQVD